MYPSNEGAWLRVPGWSVSLSSSMNAWTSSMGDHVAEVRVGRGLRCGYGGCVWNFRWCDVGHAAWAWCWCWSRWEEWIGVGVVQVRLKKLREDVACIILAADSPYPHAVFKVVLTDGMMPEINGAAVLIHVGLSRDVLCGLIVRVQVKDGFSVAVEC